MELEDEGRSGEESESESEYEEYTDSEDEMEPRLKPVFIRKYVPQLPARGGAGSLWRAERQPGPLFNLCVRKQWLFLPQSSGNRCLSWRTN